MKRASIEPRDNWQATVESQGFAYHTPGGRPYWNETAYYRFSASQIDEIEKATYALNDMCLAAVQAVIDRDLFARFEIPSEFREYIIASWNRDEFTLYGRFDLAYDGANPPKLLEYNADTPTAVLEASVVQWFWFRDRFAELDQFNSIHEKLIEAWRVRPAIDGILYFSSVEGDVEDFMTANYLRDTAMQAGLTTEYLPVEQIGWDRNRLQFVDQQNRPVRHCFKLYPWEWMVREEFGPNLLHDSVRWIEAPWKMILSNKAILPLLFEMYPESPYLLRADYEPFGKTYVQKPFFSREGANIRVVREGAAVIETAGDYEGPFVYQEWFDLPSFDEKFPILGSWMVNGNACGIGIREDDTPITHNLSRFVPHVFEP